MNEIWVMSVRTSLPKVCYAFGDMNLDVQCFDSFQKAKAAFRERLNHCFVFLQKQIVLKKQKPHFGRT